MALFVLSITAFALMPEKGTQGKKQAAQTASGAADMLDEKVFKENQSKIEALLKDNIPLYLLFFALNLLVVAVFLSGVFLDIMFLRRRFSIGASGHSPLLVRTLSNQPVAWSMGDVVRFALIFYAFAYIFMIAESLWQRMCGNLNEGSFLMMLNATVTDAMGILFVLYFVTVIRKNSVESIGLTVKNFFRNVAYGVVGYVAIIPPLVITLVVTLMILQLFHWKAPVQPIVDILIKEDNVPLLVYSSLFAAIAGPIMEEIAFRGFMYNAFKKRWGVLWGILTTSVLFSLLHGHAVGFVPILLLGILLAYLYEKTGSLVPSMTVHITHNLASLGMVFFVKGMNA